MITVETVLGIILIIAIAVMMMSILAHVMALNEMMDEARELVDELSSILHDLD